MEAPAGAAGHTMQKNRFSLLNGVISLSVLLMFAVAIVAGQARSNLNPSVTTLITDAVLPAVELNSGHIIAVVTSPLVGHN
jgi:hypothetical protein